METASQGNGDIAGVNKKKGPLAEIFGQFATRVFWKELAKTIVHEAIATFLMALGGTLFWYGKSRRNKDVAAANGNIGGGGEASNRAFGNGYSPNPTFFKSSDTSYQAPTSPNGDTRYPGF